MIGCSKIRGGLKKTLLIVVVIFISGCVNTIDLTSCKASSYSHKGKRNALNIDLSKIPSYSMFYVIKNYYVVLLKPDSVVNYLKNVGNIGNGAELLALIEKDLPIKENTDLFKYGVINTSFTSDIDFLVAEILQNGDASLIDLVSVGDASIQESATMFEVESGGKIRSFCGKYGRPIFYVVDEIWD